MKNRSFKFKYKILKKTSNKLKYKISLLNSIEREANNKICFLEREIRELRTNNKIIKYSLIVSILIIIFKDVI